MKYIKLYEEFKFKNDLKSLLKTIEDHIELNNFKVNVNINDDKITLSEGDYKIEIYDNEQDNDFFLIRIYEKDKIIQDFKKNTEKEGYSPDEIPVENILMIISRYFQIN